MAYTARHARLVVPSLVPGMPCLAVRLREF
jgi:hypothetical protein